MEYNLSIKRSGENSDPDIISCGISDIRKTKTPTHSRVYESHLLATYSPLLCTIFSNNFMFSGLAQKPLMHLRKGRPYFFTPMLCTLQFGEVGLGKLRTKKLHFQLSLYSFGYLTPNHLILSLSLAHCRL